MTVVPKGPVMSLKMPFLLAASMGVFSAITLWSIALLLSMAFGSFTYTANGQPADPTRLIRWGALPLGLLCWMSAAVVYALRFERPWSRQAILMWWIVGAFAEWLFFAVAAPGSYTIATAASPIIGFAVSFGYLYFKRSVTEYYALLRSPKPVSADPSSADVGA